MRQFISKKPHYEYLRKKWSARARSTKDNFWSKHSNALKHLALGTAGGLILLSPPQDTSLPRLLASSETALKGYDRNVLLAKALSEKLPNEVRPLESSEEKAMTEILSDQFGFKVTAELDGIRLNRSYGLIGGEQHLYRYPGDNLYAHAQSSADWAKYSDAGIAPGLGAWGYFAPSKEQFTQKDQQKERYYLAIQTFLAPGFAENFAKYRDFFKYKKMLVVNPQTGQSVVADIADAGPAEFTGKHLGGSPEVMDILGLAGGPRKGAVLYLFIDDPKDQIPLGPISVKSEVS